MRTLQEKYNGIQEGKFSKDQFLVEARQQLPNLVTRYNGYADAVQILKNRGMIKETYSTEESFKDYSDDALTDMIINSSRFEGNEEGIARVKAELARRKETVKEWSPYGSTAFSGEQEEEKETAPLSSLEVGDLVYIPGVSGDNITVKDKRGDGTVGVGHPHNDKVSYQDGNKEVQVVRRANLEEAKQPKATKKGLADYRYKPTNEMDKYPYEQILRGLRVELETLGVKDVPTAEEYTKALAKVSKNLEKDSIFYTNQVAGVNPKVDLHDKLVPVNQKQLFKTSVATPSKADGNKDTFNDLKKAQLKEGFKKLIKKVLTEGLESIGDRENWRTDKEDPLHDYMESIQPKEEEEEEVENYKKAAEEGQLDESPAKNNPKIEKLVNGINDLIAKAVDIDGDPIGIVDTQSTWQEPEVYSPIVYRNGALKITSQSPYRSEVNTEVISSKRMGDDGIETLKYLMRKYKQAAKKAGTDLYPEKEDLDETATNDNFSKWRELDQEEKDHISKFVKDTGDRDQAAYEKAREERLKAQSARLDKYIRGEKVDEAAESEKYRGYVIEVNTHNQANSPHTKFTYYNGADSDEPIGTGSSIEDCKAQIDEKLGENLDEVSESTNDIYSKPGLMVTGRTQVDNNAIGEVLDDLGLHGIWDVMGGCWFLPEEESTYDELEGMLEQEFATRGINARFEGIFKDENEDEEETTGDPGYEGYESPSDRMYKSDDWVSAQQNMMETKKSLSELLK
jgi:hypothetical protein